MRRHPQWAVATMVVAFVIASDAPALARVQHRAHRVLHANPATEPTQAPSSGMRTNGEVGPPQGGADIGKTDLPPSLGVGDAVAILGKNVRSSSGEDMGRLVDVIVDTDGQPRAAIIDFGGFLGVGSRKIAVDWSALKFVPSDPKGNVITVALTRDQVKAAPEFKEGSPVVPLGAANAPPAAPPPAPAPPQAQKK